MIKILVTVVVSVAIGLALYPWSETKTRELIFPIYTDRLAVVKAEGLGSTEILRVNGKKLRYLMFINSPTNTPLERPKRDGVMEPIHNVEYIYYQLVPGQGVESAMIKYTESPED